MRVPRRGNFARRIQSSCGIEKKDEPSRAPLFNMGKNTGTDFRLFPICLLLYELLSGNEFRIFVHKVFYRKTTVSAFCEQPCACRAAAISRGVFNHPAALRRKTSRHALRFSIWGKTREQTFACSLSVYCFMNY